MAYIDYATYTELGGTLNESSFNASIIDAEAKINAITFGKLDAFIKSLAGPIPEEIQKFEVMIIDLMSDARTSLVSGNDTSLESYSNGIESFGYNTDRDANSKLNSKIIGLAETYLWRYPELIYRGRKQ